MWVKLSSTKSEQIRNNVWTVYIIFRMYCKCEGNEFDQVTDSMLIIYAREMEIISLKLFGYFLQYREPVGAKFRFAELSERFGAFQVPKRSPTVAHLPSAL